MITKLALCAREVVRDAMTNNVSIFNIFDGLAAVGFPLLLNPFSALFVLEREEGDNAEYGARFQLLQGEAQLAAGTTQINFDDKRRTRQIVRLDGVVISAPGIITAKLWVGDNLQAAYSFLVEGPAAPPQARMTTDPA